jgi:hypothetical protein
VSPDLSRLRGLFDAAMKEYPRGLFIGDRRVHVLEELPALLDRLELYEQILQHVADADPDATVGSIKVYVDNVPCLGYLGDVAREALGKEPHDS